MCSACQWYHMQGTQCSKGIGYSVATGGAVVGSTTHTACTLSQVHTHRAVSALCLSACLHSVGCYNLEDHRLQ